MKKTSVMKTESTIQQEILLFTGTRFSGRQLCGIDKPGQYNPVCTETAQWEQACWAGLLFELIPELASHAGNESGLFLWHIMPGEHFVLMSCGSTPEPVCHQDSIDPYFFMLSVNLN